MAGEAALLACDARFVAATPAAAARASAAAGSRLRSFVAAAPSFRSQRCSARRTRLSVPSAAASDTADAAAGGPRICVLGGGFGGLYTALRLEALPWPAGGVPRVTLVDRGERFVFKPLLYELLSGELSEDEVAPRYEELLASTRVRFERAGVADVAPECQLRGAGPGSTPAGSVGGGAVLLDDGRTLPYDWAVVTLGADARAPPSVPGAAAHALPFATLDDVRALRAALDAAVRRRGGAPVRCAVVGGGVAGVELAATLGGVLRGGGAVTLLTPGDDILERGTEGQRSAARDALQSTGVRVAPRSRVVAVGPPTDADAADAPPLELRLEGDGAAAAVAADVVLWTAGTAPAVGDAMRVSLGADARGALPTDDTLRVRGHERIFALGDGAAVASSGGTQLALTAQVAFQAADYAAWNLWAAAQGRPLLPFRYQHLGEMMALGAADAAVVALPLPGGATLAGPAAALLRKAAYVYRQPGAQHALKVGAAWLQRALTDALLSGNTANR